MVKHINLGVKTVFMFTLQLGSHPPGDRMSKRLLFMTASLLTFLIFVYYTSDVTAQMTFTRPATNPINSFNDVLENEDIRVIVVTGSSWTTNLR